MSNSESPKILAMYLPQFHQIPENDEWWGEGYTEWTAVKKAEPLFEGHLQPRKPLDDNYYNLLEKETMLRQAELMHGYDVYGMCFYHYYFEKGRKLLEKPAENLLKWTDIDMPFCFSWANETWARTWSKFSHEGNPWNTVIEPEKKKEEDKGILVLQDYGEEEDWIEHFEYLLPFFKDDRYIKKDGKPVFVIHRANTVPCLTRMKSVWERLSIENGFPGIYLISTNRKSNVCDAELCIEPDYSFMRYISVHGKDNTSGVSKRVDYSSLCNNSMQLELPKREEIYFGVTPGYDDTPRKGKGGVVIENCKPEIFENYLAYYLALSESKSIEFLFINAWNEWGESMYLEPDQLNGYGFLEAVKKAKKDYRSIEIKKDINAQKKADNVAVDVYLKKLDQYESFWRVFDKWMLLKEKNVFLKSWIEKKGFKKIGIYGMGMLAQHLLSELPFEMIAYGLDRKADELRYGIPIYRDAVEAKDVGIDAMIVTVIYEFEDIYKVLSPKLSCPIYSLEELIDDEIKEIYGEG